MISHFYLQIFLKFIKCCLFIYNRIIKIHILKLSTYINRFYFLLIVYLYLFFHILYHTVQINY
ncbi:hypothetical protein H8356DRAFT_1650207 [Neocallimastix lanati (nom. inval.)]|nr:hypothetical protein H8356DRAFT_1650207 [Neocallimastix sp. JGI-2020a]